MMTGTITDDQARALAQLIATLRPGWDVAGIRAAISKARHRGTAHELVIAAIRCTQGDARTPEVIALDGPHWHTPAQTSSSNFERCPEPGHTSFPAWNCSACRSEALEAPEPHPLEPTDQLTPYDTGPALVRAELARAKTTPTGRN
jgi:hypothetical protein